MQVRPAELLSKQSGCAVWSSSLSKHSCMRHVGAAAQQMMLDYIVHDRSRVACNRSRRSLKFGGTLCQLPADSGAALALQAQAAHRSKPERHVQMRIWTVHWSGHAGSSISCAEQPRYAAAWACAHSRSNPKAQPQHSILAARAALTAIIRSSCGCMAQQHARPRSCAATRAWQGHQPKFHAIHACCCTARHASVALIGECCPANRSAFWRERC